MAAIIYLEKQNNEELLQGAVDTVVELIEEEHPELVTADSQDGVIGGDGDARLPHYFSRYSALK